MRSIITWKTVAVATAIGLTGCTQKEIPAVVGLDLNTATARLEAAGMTVGRVDKEFGSDHALGGVIRQDPASSTRVAKGTAVNLVVEDHVVVPNLVGRDVAATRDLLMEAELKPGELTETHETDAHAIGKILTQSPEMGTKVPRGSAIALEVARAAPETASATQPADGANQQVKQIMGGLLDLGRKELERKLDAR
jgi:eukaryotic-like serine/threonine-protein kinase